MKVLNLDKISKKSERTLVLGGVEYEVKAMTVGNFIEVTAAAESLSEASISEQIKATVDMICRSVPTIDKETLNNLPLEDLHQIVSFVRGEDTPEDAPEGQASEGAAEGAVEPGKQ